MTLYTDRRAFQSTLIDRISDRADYFAQQRGSDFYQPRLTEAQGRDLGFEIVWSDDHWILWKVAGTVPSTRPPKALARPACRTRTLA